MYELPFNRWTRETLRKDDIVTFIRRSKDGTTDFVTKRVSAFEGEVVKYREAKVVVPEGHIWVLGDNPKQSGDSRHFGAVPYENLRNITIAAFDAPRNLVWMRRTPKQADVEE